MGRWILGAGKKALVRRRRQEQERKRLSCSGQRQVPSSPATVRSGGPDRFADEIADPSKKFSAHCRMKALRVGTADGEQSGRRLAA